MPVRPYDREEGWALPPSLDTLIGPDHSVRFVAGYIDAITAEQWQTMGIAPDGKVHGAPSYHPRLLLGVWLWGFMQGVRSARRLELACREQISFLWLTGSQCPDHNTLWRYYQAHRAGMRYLLTDTVQLAVRLGLVDLAIQAVDGTKVSGNAARERTYDQAGLDHLLERTERAIADLEAQNTTDANPPLPRLPKALARTEALRAQIIAAKADLGDHERVNLTDGDAQLLPSRRGWVAGYNCQAVVSPLAEPVAGTSGMLVTAAEATTKAHDHGQLVPMIEAAAEATGQHAAVSVADGAYPSYATLQTCAERHLTVVTPLEVPATPDHPYHPDHFDYDAASDTYRCPEGQTLTFRGLRQRANKEPRRAYGAGRQICRACPAFGRCTRDAHKGRLLEVPEPESLLDRYRAEMATPEAKALYARRKELIEPVFGIVKEQQGLRRFLLRGRRQVNAEWQLLATTFNLRVLAGIWQHRPQLFAT